MLRNAALMMLGASLMIGCDSDTEEPSDSCQSSVDSITSPAPGFATLHGSFFMDESVIIQEGDGTQIASGTPDGDRDAFTLSVPSGDHSYHIVISCDAGRDDLGVFHFVVN